MHIPPLISIDVEGGSVVRFRWNPHQPVSARSLGRRRDADFAKEQFQTIGSKLVSVGINLDLAPVLDVSRNPMDTFLETRIISEDAGAIASDIGGAVIEGLHAGGCLSSAKHFPGNGGGTIEDSHAVTPVVDKPLEALQSYDLVCTLASAIASGVDAIMISHVLYPALDSTDIASIEQTHHDGSIAHPDGFSRPYPQRFPNGWADHALWLAMPPCVPACGRGYHHLRRGLRKAAGDFRRAQRSGGGWATHAGAHRREREGVLLLKLSLGTPDIQAQVAARTTPATNARTVSRTDIEPEARASGLLLTKA